ncbi:AbgT family transporter [Staphylococcus pseudintermedius]|uniref:AbgT family transporter n=1 Tax=Staphylococcus pseudintermedius TaxID=283734 RepID=UPI00286DC982|nr:AbgT family transporter [Staphylococcus pseudintermedius]WMZ52804.1 AbgT family transporter [Staphylococcus pseudintermedius]
MLFFSLCIVLAIVTEVVSQLDTAVKHPGTDKTIAARIILSHDGFVVFLNGVLLTFMINLCTIKNREWETKMSQSLPTIYEKIVSEQN